VRFVRYVLPLLLWMGVIYAMSSRVGSAENTAPMVVLVLRRLWPGLLEQLTPERLDFLNYLIRKSAHVVEYGILTVLAVRALQQDRLGWRWLSAAGAVIFSLLYASADEWHQKFVTSRTGTIIDVGVDAIGVVLAIGLCWLWYRGNRGLAHELSLLAELRERGALTEREFDAAKRRVIGR
jgi:VanZ family protein